MHISGEVDDDGWLLVTFETTEPDPAVEVLLDVDFLLHAQWPDLSALVLRGVRDDPSRRRVSVRLPADARLSYRFLRRDSSAGCGGVGESGGVGGVGGATLDNLRDLVGSARPDPEVGTALFDTFGSGTGSSIWEGPRAMPPHRAWSGARTVPHPARVEEVGCSLGPAIWIRPQGEPDRVAILLDGDIWLGSLDLRRVAGTLERSDGGPWSTALLVVPVPERGILAERAAMAALAGELVDLAADRLGGRPGRDRVAVFGQSYGGLAAAGMAADVPDVVGTAVASSGSFWFTTAGDARDSHAPGDLTRDLADRDLSGTRFVLHVGREEGAMVGQSRDFATAARAAGATASMTIVPGGHDYAWYGDVVLTELERW